MAELTPNPEKENRKKWLKRLALFAGGAALLMML